MGSYQASVPEIHTRKNGYHKNWGNPLDTTELKTSTTQWNRPSKATSVVRAEEDSFCETLKIDPPPASINTTLNDAIVPRCSDQSSLLLQISSTVIEAALLRNGKAELIPIDDDNGSSTPLWIALVDKKLFIYGKEAMKWIQSKRKANGRVPATSSYWNLGQLLVSNEKLERESVMFDDEILDVSFEFLFALYLRHLKDTALQKMKIDKFSLRSIIFTVPLWMGSVQRQRIKDAGTIAEFQNVFLLNEITANVLFKVASASNQDLVNFQKQITYCKRFLVLNENSGNVDIATYEFSRDFKGQKLLQMVTCTGNLYESPKTKRGVALNIMKMHYDGDQNLEHPRTQVFMKSLVTNLLLEAVTNYSPKKVSFDIIICSQNKMWFSYFVCAVKNCFEAPPTVYQNSENALTCLARLSSDINSLQILSEMLPDKIIEMSPYTFYRRDFVLDLYKDSMLEKYSKLSKDVQVITKKIQSPKASTQLVLFQRNVLHKEISVGTLEIKMCAYYIYAEIVTSFLVDHNGLIRFYNVYGIPVKGSKKFEMVPKEYFVWKGSNLSDTQVLSYEYLLSSTVNSFQKIEKKLFENKQNIIRRCETMKRLMEEGKYKMPESKKTQDYVQSRIENGLLLKQLKTPLELAEVVDLENKLRVVKNIHRKYF